MHFITQPRPNLFIKCFKSKGKVEGANVLQAGAVSGKCHSESAWTFSPMTRPSVLSSSQLRVRTEAVRPSISDSPILACAVAVLPCQHPLYYPNPIRRRAIERRSERAKRRTDGRTKDASSVPLNKNKRGAERSLDGNKVCFARRGGGGGGKQA